MIKFKISDHIAQEQQILPFDNITTHIAQRQYINCLYVMERDLLNFILSVTVL